MRILYWGCDTSSALDIIRAVHAVLKPWQHPSPAMTGAPPFVDAPPHLSPFSYQLLFLLHVHTTAGADFALVVPGPRDLRALDWTGTHLTRHLIRPPCLLSSFQRPKTDRSFQI